MRSAQSTAEFQRRVQREAFRESTVRDDAFRRIIQSVPKGRVTTYGRVAAAAGYPLLHRAVAQLLRKEALTGLPWQRVVGSGGEIRLKAEFAEEQRLRLRMEGVRFDGKRLNMARYEYALRSWETSG